MTDKIRIAKILCDYVLSLEENIIRIIQMDKKSNLVKPNPLNDWLQSNGVVWDKKDRENTHG